jgi:23S rRNA pseudouridine1911/1915/1917 synthase
MRIDFIVNEQYDGKKVHHVLQGQMKLSSRLIKNLKKHDGILLNGASARTIDPVHSGDIVSAVIEYSENINILPEESDISIIYEDECFLAVDKKAGVPVHPSAGHQTGTLVHMVLAHFKKQGLIVKARPINRLDKDTSGIVLFAKNSFVQDRLIAQMKNNRVEKIYLGIVHGVYDPPEGVIDLPIARKENSTIERVIDPEGDRSVTRYKTLAVHNDLSLVQFALETGRTHQIRVHTKAMGHPLLGDWLYSDIRTDLIDRQALHSTLLAFDHPITSERIILNAPIPGDMRKVLGN